MARPKSLKPAYCHHKSTGRAFVVLDGEFKYLGNYGTQESHDAYALAIAEWISRGRMPAPAPATEGTNARPYTVKELVDAYWTHAQAYYVDAEGKPTSEVETMKQALRPIKRLYGLMSAIDFGPKALRAVRQVMIDGDKITDKTTPAAGTGGPWARKHINKQISRLRGMFKWGAGQELIPASIYHSLATLEPLKRGRTTAKETAPIRPVAQAHVQAVLPFLSRHLQAMVQLQLLTGARGGELATMRTSDIDRTGDVWTYRPGHHKTEHHGIERIIRIGPKGREILMPFLKMNRTAYIFSPADAEDERREKLAEQRRLSGTPLSCGNTPGDNVKENPDREPGERYDHNTYCRAIARACDAAFPPPDALARGRVAANGRKKNRATRWETDAEWKKRLAKKWAELEKWRDAHRFHPHQLRHSAATFIRQAEGVEMARIILGHRHLSTTEIYAEADTKKAAEMMKRIG